MIRICYIDESGCTGNLPTATSPIQPAFILGAVVFHQNHLANITHEFIKLKRTYFPGLTPNTVPLLHHVKAEVKGGDIRSTIRNGNRNQLRHSLGFLDKFIGLLEHYNTKIFGRIWIKGIGQPINGRSIYTFSMQAACADFQHLLNFENMEGMMIADSRTPVQNIGVSHSIFTQKFKSAGDAYNKILEMPTFGHSANHVGLQLADLLCSAILFPIATYTYCTGHVDNVHVNQKYRQIKERYSARIMAMQYRYLENSRFHGGITVNDAIAKRSGSEFFRT